MLIVDATIVTNHGTQRIAKQCENLNEFESEVRDILANSEEEEELFSCTINGHREASESEEQECHWLNLTPDGYHPFLDNGHV